MAYDNQTQVQIRVLQGEREMADGNRILGEVTLEGIPPALRDTLQVEVTFDIDVNGLVTLSAKDKASGTEQQIKVSSGGLTENEIEKMIKEAEQQAEKDKEKKQLAVVRISADSTIYSIENSLTKYKKWVPHVVVTEIESAISKLREAKGFEDAFEIKLKINAANRTVSKIGECLARRL